MKKQLLAFLFSSFCVTIFSQQLNIIPKPNEVILAHGNFIITQKTSIVYANDGEKNTADFLNGYLKKYYGFKLPIVKQATSNFIRLALE